MKTKPLLLLATILVILVAGSAPQAATAGDAVVPFKASYIPEPKIVGMVNGCLQQQLPAKGQATHLGESAFYSDAQACMNGVQTGTMEFTAANGDKLFGYFEGTHAGYPGTVEFVGTFWITGGSGRFEDVTGTGAYWGKSGVGIHELYFDGKLFK
jgi:hypothetical protein